MRAAKLATMLFAGALLGSGRAQAANLSPDDAGRHVGETATVCGRVASATYAERSRGSPTFLNIDKAYPGEIFTLVIWGDDRAPFGAPEKALMGKRLCATGLIERYRNRVEMVVRAPSQLHQP